MTGVARRAALWAALVLLAFALLVAEVNVDGFGVLGILGWVSFVLGGVLLFGHFGTPSPVLPAVRVSPWVLAPAAAVMAAGAGGLAYAVLTSRRRQRALGAKRSSIRVFHHEDGAVAFWTALGYHPEADESVYAKDLG